MAAHIAENKGFVGRDFEREKISEINMERDACIIVVYGRRRIGKTELIEQSFRKRNLLKFEGVEGGNTQKQMSVVLNTLATYQKEPYISDLQFNHWLPFFEFLAKFVKDGEWTIYFEELQWLAEHKDNFIADLKHAWDNYFKKNAKLRLILCGSSPSFMINNVLNSKALYNRAIYEIPLHEFTLQELKEFLPRRSERELMDTYLTVGGVAEYLNRIKKSSSLFLGICQHAFTRGGFFVNESERIFVSSLSENKHYKSIIQYLARVKFATRQDIAKHLKISSGGQLTSLLLDLSVCGFIESYTPFDQKVTSLLMRYCIRDPYLMFYFKYIEPVKKDILAGSFNADPINAIDAGSFQKWLGYAFERFCRRQHRKIASILGFSAVRYQSGVYFNRRTNKEDPGFQVDLVFQRADNVITICEIKYLNKKADTSVIEPFDRKLALIDVPTRYSIERVLITTEGATDALIGRAYFNKIIKLEDLFV